MDTEIIVWQLGRIYAAGMQFRGQEALAGGSIAWWEAGSIWSVVRPANAMDFTAFQIGVAIREIGGLSLLTAILPAFAERSGDTAARWLAEIWAELQPDWEARSQFLSSLGA